MKFILILQILFLLSLSMCTDLTDNKFLIQMKSLASSQSSTNLGNQLLTNKSNTIVI